MHSLPNSIVPDGGYPILSAQNINNGIIDKNTSKFVSQEIFDIENRRTDIKEGDVLLTIVGAIGRVAVVPDGLKALFQRSICVIKPDHNKILSEYLRFTLESSSIQNYIQINAHGAAQKGIYLDKINKIKIPLPPLEVQREIVRVLDKFTMLSAELSAELSARQKQYSFYREHLLSFQNNIKIYPLRYVIRHSCSGSTPSKGKSEYYDNGSIPWIRTQDVRFNEIYSVDSYITELAVKETAAKWIPENCVIVAISGASAGRCAINKIRATTNQHCLNLEIDSQKALYRYVYHCVCQKYQDLLAKKQGARGDLNSTLILDTEIPVPPLDVQQRIVNVLDNFDAICSDLNIGLPAEISARQKQYEYYRDLLLSFKNIDNITDRA